jgi:AraC-like DNA-binding protein
VTHDQGKDRIDRWVGLLAASEVLDHVDPPGHRPDLLAVPAERRGLEALALIDGQAAPAARPPQRDADVFAAMLVETGRATVGYENQTFPLGAGDALFWDGGVPLAFDVAEPVRRRVILFPRASVIQLCPEYGALLGRPITDRGELVGTLFEVVHLLRVRVPGLGLRIRQTAADLLLQLVGGLDPATDRLRDSAQVRMLDRILRYIDANLGDPALSPAGIATAHAISERSLYSLFRAVGVPVGAHIRDQRLHRGYRDVVEDTGEPLARIADRWGFASASHFSRLFRDRYGLPPSRLRATGAVSRLPAGGR